MSKELAIVEHVLKTRRDVDMLEALVEHIPTMPTPDLVTGFRLANTFVKRIETFTDAAKKELVDNATMKGRFLSEGRADEKGHLYLAGVEGDALKAEKRVYAKFNAEKAEELLKEKDLLALGSEQRVTCTDPAKVLELIDTVYKKLFHTLDSKKVVEQDLAEMKALFEVTQVVTEARVEALVALEKIETSDVAKVMDVGIQYAVKEVKAKKK